MGPRRGVRRRVKGILGGVKSILKDPKEKIFSSSQEFHCGGNSCEYAGREELE